LEGILLALLRKDKSGEELERLKKKKMVLGALINEAEKEGILTDLALNICNKVNSWRIRIHPGRDIDEKIELNGIDAQFAYSAIFIVLREINNK
jgi:hypothetical protein